MIRKLIATTATWAALPVRLTLGVIFIAHGAQKVLGVWGGPGWSAFTGGTTPFSFMRPAWFWLGAAALSELVGGVLVLLGLLTRVGAFFLTATMLTAIFGYHLQGGFFLSNKGYEYALALLGMSVALLVSGGGRASVDEYLQQGARGRRR